MLTKNGRLTASYFEVAAIAGVDPAGVIETFGSKWVPVDLMRRTIPLPADEIERRIEIVKAANLFTSPGIATHAEVFAAGELLHKLRIRSTSANPAVAS